MAFLAKNAVQSAKTVNAAGAASTALEIKYMKKRRPSILYDVLSPYSSLLLHSTLKDHLPHYSSGVKPLERTNHRLSPGHHLVYFRPPTPESYLLDDGTDNIHQPSSRWKHRLWAGGYVKFPRRTYPALNGRKYVQVERVEDVRVTGEDTKAEKVFVKVLRTIGASKYQETDGETVRRLAASSIGPDRALIIESRDLCFMQQIPEAFSDAALKRTIEPPSLPYLSHSLLPTRALLFRFSALTFNAHAIHIDPEYTRREYGLPNLLVHGPLTLVLMLEIMVKAVQKRDMELGRSPHKIHEISYKNLAPLFVDEPITICCKISEPDVRPTLDHGTPWISTEHWQVWVEKGEGRNTSLAVRGSVMTVGYAPDEGLLRKRQKEEKEVAAAQQAIIDAAPDPNKVISVFNNLRKVPNPVDNVPKARKSLEEEEEEEDDDYDNPPRGS